MEKGIQPTYLGDDVFIIDQMEMDIPNRTGSYLIKAESTTLIEIGASPAVPYLLNGLKHLDVSLEEVEYIIVTHIHLDHAGGAGLMMQKCPNAKLVVHPRGAKHMKDPSKLIASAKSVYGEEFDRLFAPITPVPEERILIKNDGEKLNIGNHRTLEFLDTPGHAMHHFSIYDPCGKGIFTGDTVALRYPYFEALGVTFYMPTTSPTQFSLEMMTHSWEKILKYEPLKMYFGHFGMSENIEDVFTQVRSRAPYFVEIAQKTLEMGEGEEMVYHRLLETIAKEWKQWGIPDDHPAYRILEFDMKLNAAGIVFSINRTG